MFILLYLTLLVFITSRPEYIDLNVTQEQYNEYFYHE